VFSVFHYEKTFKEGYPDPKLYFNGYVDTFLKLKYEASGFPVFCKTQQEKDDYIAEINRRDNIQLNPGNMKKNSSMKTISKLFLNSLYG